MSKTDSVGKAIHEMHENLIHLTEQHSESNWMQSGKEKVNEILRGEKILRFLEMKYFRFSLIF